MKTRILFVLALLGWLYFMFGIYNDPRMDDHQLDWAEMHAYEYPIFLITLFGSFVLYFLGVISCFKAKKTFLGVISILMWPLAVIMAVINSGENTKVKNA